MPEMSPLCEALRAGDDEIVLLLLQYRASPSRREEGSNDPIFVAIQMGSAENVRRLLQFSADQGQERRFRRLRGMRADADSNGVQLWRLLLPIHNVSESSAILLLEHDNLLRYIPNLLFPLSGQDYWHSGYLSRIFVTYVTQVNGGRGRTKKSIL